MADRSQERSLEYGIGLAHGPGMFFPSRRGKFSFQRLRHQLRKGFFWAAVGGLFCTFAGLVSYPFLGTIVRRLIASRDVSMADGSDNGSTGNQEDLAVIEALQLLPQDYVVLTNLMLPDSDDNIDHLVMGPTGPFIIESENYSTEVTCLGDEWSVHGRKIHSLSQQVKRNAAAIKNFLTPVFIERRARVPTVVPLLVFINPNGRLTVNQPTLPVLRLAALAQFIAGGNPANVNTPASSELNLAIVRQLQLLQRMPNQLFP